MKQDDAIGSVGISVNVRVDAAEMAQWKPETIRAFFAGMSLVLSARRSGDLQSRMDASMAVLGVAVDGVGEVARELVDQESATKVQREGSTPEPQAS